VLARELRRVVGLAGGDRLERLGVLLEGAPEGGRLAAAPGLDGEARTDLGRQLPAEADDLRVAGAFPDCVSAD
jgi:hypothetical protein